MDRFARDAGIPNDPAPGLNIELNARRYRDKFPNKVGELAGEIPISIKGMDISCSGLNSWLKTYIDKNVNSLTGEEK